MNAVSAIGWLLTFAINHLADAADSGAGCCNQCCGTCSALAWFRLNAPAADEYVHSTMIEPDDLSQWQHPDGRINWDHLAKAWAVPCEFADDHETEVAL